MVFECLNNYQQHCNCQPAKNGYFGQDCAKKCIETCDGCNNINGLCNNGCMPGWSGYFCNQRLGIFHLIVFFVTFAIYSMFVFSVL